VRTGCMDVDVDDLEGRRRRVKSIASDLQATCRAVLRRNMAEAVLCGDGGAGDTGDVYIGMNICSMCRKPPAAGNKLRFCRGCKVVSYCTRECQKAHYPIHKTICREQAEIVEENNALGVDNSKRHHLQEWFHSIPCLLDGVTCKAWQHRKESPFILVQGGVNARMAESAVYPRSRWGALGDANAALAAQYSRADFSDDKMFLVVIRAGHAGTENWPEMTMRQPFPCPPDDMDAWVEEKTRMNPQVRGVNGMQAPAADAAPPRIKQPCACGSGKKFKKCCHNT
jgi:hypothetical protein